MWKFKGPRRAKTTLKKGNKFGGLTPPDFRLIIKLQKSRKCIGVKTDKQTNGTE